MPSKAASPLKAGAVSHAGGHGDHRAGDQTADDAGQRAFHAGADHHHARLGQPLAIAHQAVNAGDSDIVDGVHFVAHQFGGDLGFLGHRDIAGAGADHGDPALAVHGAVAPEADGAGKRKVFGAGELRGDQGGALAVGARDQHVLGIGQQALRDGGDLFRRLALGEDHFRHAVAQGAMVVHLGEAQVFKRHVPHAPHGCVDIYRAGAHLFEQRAQLVLVHDARISESPGQPAFVPVLRLGTRAKYGPEL